MPFGLLPGSQGMCGELAWPVWWGGGGWRGREVAGHRHTASRPWPMDRLSVCDREAVGVGAFRPAAGVAGDVWRIGRCVWGGAGEREGQREGGGGGRPKIGVHV